MTEQCMHIRTDCRISDERNRFHKMEFDAWLRDSE